MSAKPEKKEPTEEAPPKKSKKLLIIIVGIVLLLVLAGGGAFMLLKKPPVDPDAEEEVVEEVTKNKKAKHDPKAIPIFSNLEVITANLLPEKEGEDRYIQVNLTLELEDPHTEADIKLNMPRIRSNLLLMISADILHALKDVGS